MAKPSQHMDLPDLPCACATVRRAARIVTQLYDAELRRSGLEASQFTLLEILSHKPGVSQSTLAKALALDKTTISRNLRVLRKNGWIVPAEASDQRERGYRLTAAGREVMGAARPAWKRAQGKFRESLGEGAWESMWKVFGQVATAGSQAKHAARK